MSLVLPRGWLILFYTKRKLSDVVEKSIPKNIGRDLKQKNVIFKIERSPIDKNKLMLTINQQPISEWFKEQWEKLQQHLRNSVQKEQKSRGFRM